MEPAGFYQREHRSLTELRARDRLLGGATTLWPQVSARAYWPAWPNPARWELGASGALIYQRFHDFALRGDRAAVTAELWVTRYF